ncbi:MAG: hypothetical protein ACI9TO_000941 [Rickettsiales bacterium]|jgi:hypothetical protein
MLKNYKFLLKTFSLVVAVGLLSNCASRFETIYKTPPAKYEKLGRVSGTASGSLGVVSTAYYAIPMGINSRVSRAYQDALSQAPGATSLIDVTYKESWFWWVIGTGRTVTISGEAIKEIK